MKLVSIAIVSAALSSALLAQENPTVQAPAAPKIEAAPAPAPAAAASAPAAEAPKAEAAAPAQEAAAPAKIEPAPAPAAAEEAKKEEKKEEKPAAQVAEKKQTPVGGLDAEWRFLREAADDSTSGVPEAATEDLAAFIQQHPNAPMMGEAQALLASLYQKNGDYKPAMVALFRLLYEHPDAKTALQAQSDLLALGDKKLSRKLRPALGDMVKVPEIPDTSGRLALMLERIVDGLGDALYEPAVLEIRRFQIRFPDYPKSDAIQWSLGQLHEKDERYPAALLAYRKLLAAYPESSYLAKAEFAIGGIYADDLRDYKKAIEAYQDLAEKFPNSPEVLPSLQRTSQLFSDRLRQYELAVQVDERIIKLFAKSDGALKAFNDEAKIQRDRLSKPDEAIKTYQRLTEQFGAPAAVEALRNAATVARKDLRDYKLEAELRGKIAASYPDAKEAAEELYNSASVYESDVKDRDKALSVYREVTVKYAQSKPARWATARIVKLEKNKPQ